jgi:hypothetical protein
VDRPDRSAANATLGASVYFYELHEGDSDLFADLLLAREQEMEPEVFFETVRAIRERVLYSHEHDTLIEAIAEELEQDYDFIFISDDRLTAAVNVSRDPQETFLADLDAEDQDEDDALGDADYRAVIAEFQGRPSRPN